MTGSRWIEDVNAGDVLAVAVALGLTVGRSRSFGPCPACGADRRGNDDRRGPCGARGDGHGWRCHRCDVHGDAVALVALVATGQARPPEWTPVRALAASAGLCEADTRDGAPPVARAPRVEVVVPPPEPVRALPPRDEVRALWAACDRVHDEGDVAVWLATRNVDPIEARRIDAVRVLPRGPLPTWARIGPRPWSDGWTAIVPAYDDAGELVTVRARWTGDRRAVRVKANGGTDVATGPAVLADPVARWLLRVGPDARPGDVCPDFDGGPVRWDGRVWIVEGEPAWLRLATARARWADGPGSTLAVFGVWSGAWPADDRGRAFGARIPSAARVVVATDDNPAGDRYADAIGATLTARHGRYRPPADLDELDP